MRAELNKLNDIFEEISPSLESHKHIRRIKRYSKTLKRLSNLELNIAVTIELVPHYVAGTMTGYIRKDICKKFKVNLDHETIARVVDILNEICRIKLYE